MEIYKKEPASDNCRVIPADDGRLNMEKTLMHRCFLLIRRKMNKSFFL